MSSSHQICSSCGRIWDIEEMEYPMRNKCSCGASLVSWNSAEYYTSRLTDDE